MFSQMSHKDDKNIIIISGSDQKYLPLLNELLMSISGIDATVGVIDGGLNKESINTLKNRRVDVKSFEPEEYYLKKAIDGRPALRVNLAKVWLDKIFPNFDLYIFLDADTWVQDRWAMAGLIGAARMGGLAICPTWDRYRDLAHPFRWWFGRIGELRSFNAKSARHARLPKRIFRTVAVRPDLNAGVFALAGGQPHWERMRYWQRRIVRAGGKPFTSDGLSMALACHVDGLKLHQMTAFYNYLGPWLYDPGKRALVDAFFPHEPVGIVHLADMKEIRSSLDYKIPITGTDGLIYDINPRFPGVQKA